MNNKKVVMVQAPKDWAQADPNVYFANCLHFFVCEEANKTLNYLRLIANKANKLQRPIKIKIKASIKVPPALKRDFC